MTQPAFYLFSPSREDAIRLGMGGWYDWFQSQENVQVVDDTREVASGVFLSFTPICKEEDTFGELEGRAQRWMALDCEGNVSSSTILAKKCGVDRLLHAALIDEMSSPVIPAALLFLLKRGIWLPNTFVRTSNISLPAVKEEVDRADKLLLFLFEEPFVKNWRLRFLLKMLDGDLNPFGYRTRVVGLAEFQSGDLVELPSQMVLLSDEPETVLKVSQWAKVHSVRFATLENPEQSPLRCVIAGGSYPESISIRDAKLRPFFRGIGELVRNGGSEDCDNRESISRWNQPKSLEDFKFAWTDGDETSQSIPRIFGTFLTSNSGGRFLNWARERISKRSCYQYTPLFYSCEFFREHSPFEILCDEALREQYQLGISRLRELLEVGYRASKGYGTMYVLYLSWCSILLKDYEKVVTYFSSAREPSFSAISGYAAEIGLALWYSNQVEAARNCAEVAKSIEPAKDVRPCRFKTVCSLLEGGAIGETFEREALASRDWVAVQAAALASKNSGDVLWRRASELGVVQTQSFEKLERANF